MALPAPSMVTACQKCNADNAPEVELEKLAEHTRTAVLVPAGFSYFCSEFNPNQYLDWFLHDSPWC